MSPATLPTIRIRRLDTNALVVTDANMTEVGDGSYSYAFASVATLEYSVRSDGDPAAALQVPAADRYQSGAIDTSLPDDILSHVISPHETTPGTVGEALSMLINRLEVNITLQTLELYDFAGTTLLRSWPLATDGGENVTTLIGVQTKRGVPS